MFALKQQFVKNKSQLKCFLVWIIIIHKLGSWNFVPFSSFLQPLSGIFFSIASGFSSTHPLQPYCSDKRREIVHALLFCFSFLLHPRRSGVFALGWFGKRPSRWAHPKRRRVEPVKRAAFKWRRDTWRRTWRHLRSSRRGRRHRPGRSLQT